MRTVRLLTVSQHALRRGVSASGPGVCVCLWSRGVYPSIQWGRRPPVDRQTPVKTLPSQISFAGGKYC